MLFRKSFISVLFFFFYLCSDIFAMPLMPARIGGTLTLNITTQVKNQNLPGVATINNKQITDEGNNYKFVITRQDGTLFTPPAEDTDGLNDFDSYVIDIPIYDPNEQPTGAKPGDLAVIHVYNKGNKELTLISPPNGYIIVGNSGSINEVNLVVQHDYIIPGDINNDGKIGIEETIYSLQVMTGLR